MSIPAEQSPACAFRQRADELVDWAWSLLNRSDAWGAYLPLHKRNGSNQYTAKGSLTRDVFARHFRGEQPEDVIGLHVIDPITNCCKWFTIDVDAHGEVTQKIRDANWRAALAWDAKLSVMRMYPLLLDSNNDGGFHLFGLLDVPIPAAVVFRFVRALIADWRDYGLSSEPEAFPKQPSIGPDKFGNWFRIPGRHHTRDHWSRVWNGEWWAEGDEAIDLIVNLPRSPSEIVTELAPAENPSVTAPKFAEPVGDRITEPGRNNVLTSLAGTMRRRGMGEAAIYAALAAENRAKCHPPLDDSEIRDIARKISQYPPHDSAFSGNGKARREAEKPACDADDDDGCPDMEGRCDRGSALDESLVALGTRDPATGRLVLSPTKTLPTARAFVAQFYSHSSGRKLHSYAGAILAWRGNRFMEVEEQTIKNAIQPWLHDALRYQYNRGTKMLELVRFDSNPSTENAALESIRVFTHLPGEFTPPCWLNSQSGRPDPRNLLPFPSGTLDLTTGKTLEPTPALFNINAINFEYNPSPDPPERWIHFLAQLWGDDLESVNLLQEWMGYCLVGDTSQQKMLLMTGPRRSGKGTIARVMRNLIGKGNCVHPTTSSLAGTFGLQPLIGKSLAVISDARFGGENIGVVVERLLCISGEDAITIDRKFIDSVSMKLPTKFMFLTNELPRLNDASVALAGRFIILRLIKSFYGQEDTTLSRKLMRELPGILVWAIDGLKRLRKRGYFAQPQSVADTVRQLEDLASPVLAFTRDKCLIAPGERVFVDELYLAWKAWCAEDGRISFSNKQNFGRDLGAAFPQIAYRRGTGDVPFYDGISVRPV